MVCALARDRFAARARKGQYFQLKGMYKEKEMQYVRGLPPLACSPLEKAASRMRCIACNRSLSL
ncbi:hypothetical protein KDH_77170 [Dictyobacter sp. S3.2.2.5]|uniref:Uncharacterized protein n=1 Tax=Dictyobacter halimunensis TaxID=3026934 RepID=A0ABQ6G7S4_9CHLR|nr:hypothetical protein KDH_77170 [Dictyobacter sp. S3.2.2.5]